MFKYTKGQLATKEESLTKKRFHVSRETIRTLAAQDLSGARGGGDTPNSSFTPGGPSCHDQ